MSQEPSAPVEDWRTDWDHGDPAWAADPHLIWADLRAHCPVARTERYGGAVMVTTWDLVDEVTHDPATYSSRETGVRPPGTNTKKSPPITSDPPEHQEHRRVLLPSFAPQAIAVNRDMGLAEMGELDPADRGAGDISFVAKDVDGLVGLGPASSGSHTAEETVDVPSISKQAKRAAILMSRLAAERR